MGVSFHDLIKFYFYIKEWRRIELDFTWTLSKLVSRILYIGEFNNIKIQFCFMYLAVKFLLRTFQHYLHWLIEFLCFMLNLYRNKEGNALKSEKKMLAVHGLMKIFHVDINKRTELFVCYTAMNQSLLL